MDWTLWDTAFDQAAQETSYHISQGWQYDFYFGYGLDVIEEAALNEKSLIQVLRLLITEADNEILELEEDLVILQSQLAWADKEWSELCSAALKEKIECLDIAIQSLKNGSVHDEDEFEDCYQLPREPAERIHDILKALLRSYFQQKDKQAPNLVQNSTLNADKLAIGHSKKERVLSSSNLEMNMESPQKMSSTRTTTSAPILDLSVKPERRRTGTEDREKPETAVVKYSSPHNATGCNLEKRLSLIDPITIKETEVKEKCSKSIILRPSLDLEGKGTKTSETVKPADTALDSRTNAVKEATEDSISNSKQSKEPEAACPNNISTSKPSLKKYKRRITSAGRVRAREAIITGTEPCVTNLLLELPNHRKENRTRPQSKKTQRQLPKQFHEAEVGVTDEDTNSDSSTKPSRRRLKRKCHSNISEELGLILNSSSRKTAGFSRSKKGTIKEEKKAQSDMCGAEDVKLSFVSLSQKKRKICPSSKKELRGLDISLASTTEEDGWIAECHLAVDSAIEPVKLLPCPNVVEYLTLVELRAIGKQQKLKGYYRLRKAELAKKLGLEIHGRGRSKGKGNGAGILSLMPGGTETEIRTPTIEDKDFVEGKALTCPKMLKAEEETEHHLELVTC